MANTWYSIAELLIITFYFGGLVIVFELDQTWEITARFDDDLPLDLWQQVELLSLFGGHYAFWELPAQYVVHQVLILAIRVVLYRQDDGEVRRVVFQELIHGFYGFPEAYRLAKALAFDPVCYYGLVVALVVDVQLHALYPFLQVFNVTRYLAVTRQLVPCQVSIVGTEAKVVY